jgi:hypothetical protein
MGWEVEIQAESIAIAQWKYLKILVFCCFLKGLQKVAGRQGVFAAAFRNPSKDRHFLHNSHDVSELAFFTFFRRLPFVSFCFRVLPVQ